MVMFFKNPTKKFQLRELARISEISTTGVKSSLLELLKENIIIKIREKKYEFYEASRSSEIYKIYKKFFTIKTLHKSGLVAYLEKELNYPEAIVLFGSAARGEDVERSDIDIFVLTSVKKPLNLEKFNKQLKREIKLMMMKEEEFDNAKQKNPELINNITNGINLKGFLEVI